MIVGAAIVLCIVGDLIGTGFVATVVKTAIWLGWPVILWVTGWIDRREKEQLVQLLATIWPRRRAHLDAITK